MRKTIQKFLFAFAIIIFLSTVLSIPALGESITGYVSRSTPSWITSLFTMTGFVTESTPTTTMAPVEGVADNTIDIECTAGLQDSSFFCCGQEAQYNFHEDILLKSVRTDLIPPEAVTYRGYTIYPDMGENQEWVRFVVKAGGYQLDLLGIDMSSMAKVEGTDFYLRPLEISVPGDDLSYVETDVQIGIGLFDSEHIEAEYGVVGTASATTPVVFEYYFLYAEVGSNDEWAIIKIKNSEGTLYGEHEVLLGETVNTESGLAIKLLDVEAEGSEVIGARLSVTGANGLMIMGGDIIYEYVFDDTIDGLGSAAQPNYENPVQVQIFGKTFTIVGVGNGGIKALVLDEDMPRSYVTTTGTYYTPYEQYKFPGETEWIIRVIGFLDEGIIRAGDRIQVVYTPSEIRYLIPGSKIHMPNSYGYIKALQITTTCYTNSNCASGKFCEFPVGNCEGPGTCVSVPEACIETYEPVCGCDGDTYSNNCHRMMSSVSKNHAGECESQVECAQEGEYTSGAVAPEYYLPCCAGLEGMGVSEDIVGAGLLCYDPQKGYPVCKHTGTQSEGWYYSNGEMLRYGTCGYRACSDSDGGINYYEKGELSNVCAPDADCGVFVERCLDDWKLFEFSCDYLGGKTYICPHGCSQGACIRGKNTVWGDEGIINGYNHLCMNITIESSGSDSVEAGNGTEMGAITGEPVLTGVEHNENMGVVPDVVSMIDVVVEATFNPLTDTESRIFTASIDCLEKEGLKAHTWSDGCVQCAEGRYCKMGIGTGGAYRYVFYDVEPGEHTLCIWPNSEQGKNWTAVLEHAVVRRTVTTTTTLPEAHWRLLASGEGLNSESHLCGEISLYQPSRVHIKGRFVNAGDEYARLLMSSIDCPEIKNTLALSAEEGWALHATDTRCTRETCEVGYTCVIGCCGSGDFYKTFSYVPIGQHEICIWPNSPKVTDSTSQFWKADLYYMATALPITDIDKALTPSVEPVTDAQVLKEAAESSAEEAKCGDGICSGRESAASCCVDCGCGEDMVCSARLNRCVRRAMHINGTEIMNSALGLETMEITLNNVRAKVQRITNYYEGEGNELKWSKWNNVLRKIDQILEKIGAAKTALRENRANLTESIIEEVREAILSLKMDFRELNQLILEAL